MESASIHQMILEIALASMASGFILALTWGFIGYAINRAIKLLEDFALK